MLGLDIDKVVLVPHNEDWIEEYEKEKINLKKVLGDYILDIQHVGSTAIPGLKAKPILDIAVAVKDIDTLYTLIPIIEEAGYGIKNSIDTLGELLAKKGNEGHRTHLIHIEVLGSTFWNNHILFRDYLLKYPKVVKEYESLKEDLLEKYKDDRKTYTASKNDFIQKILIKAKEEFK